MIALGDFQPAKPWTGRAKTAAEELVACEAEEVEESRQAYEAGTIDRMNPLARGIDPLGADADTHYPAQANYYLMIERGRKAVRDHGLVEQGVNRLLANLQLDDVTLDVDSGDAELDKDHKAWFREWAGDKSRCDYEGERNLGELANQSFFSKVVDGDIFHLPLAIGSIQTWEGHHCRTPHGRQVNGTTRQGIVHGVEVRDGRAFRYWFTPATVSPYSRRESWKATPFRAWDDAGSKIVWHLAFKQRFNQRRGISRLAAPRNAMNGFDELNWAHIHAAKRRALIAFVQERAGAGVNPFGGHGIPQTGERTIEQDGLFQKTIEMLGEPASVLRAPAGEKLSGWNANMPGSQFFEQAALLLSILAVNLDIPLSFLLLDGSLTNFHGGRMVFDQARMRFQKLQRDHIAGFYNEVYRWKTRQRATSGSPEFDPAFARAMNRGDVNPLAFTFRAKGWPYVKPAEDVAAEDVAERRNLRSSRAILAARGIDLDEHYVEIVNDRADLLRLGFAKAKEIKDEFPEAEIDVGQLGRELAYGANPSGVQLALSATQPESSNPNEAPGRKPSMDDTAGDAADE